MLESQYQALLIKRLEYEFPKCVIIKNDPTLFQGILDLTVLHGRHWAMLEVKASANSRLQPNQQFYVTEWDKIGFASFVYPENEEEVFNALQAAFSPCRNARHS